MIPQRVKLQGFLSYQDEQEVAFDGSALWMLAGLNGSGKSTVFDAVTFALFGHHRGGSQQAVELVNKNSDGFVVEFDFLLDSQLYRARRTLKRAAKGSPRTTQQLARWESNGDAGHWQPLDDTAQKTGYDTWIRDHLGLNYETFTSSVLLVQGKAEKLLDSSPKGRFEVLAGIVDLERYQKLHERSAARQREHKGQVEALQAQLAGTTEVTDEQLQAAATTIAEAEQGKVRAGDEAERWAGLLHEARKWAEARAKLEAARQRWTQAEQLLGDAAGIERDFARLRELRDALPHVRTAVSERSAVTGCDKTTALLTEQRQQQATKADDMAHLLERDRKQRQQTQQTLAADEGTQKTVNARLQALAGVLNQLRAVEQQQAEVTRLGNELSRLPADPDATVRQFAKQDEQLQTLARALPVLEMLYGRRNDLGKAKARRDTAQQRMQEVQERGSKLSEQLKTREDKVKDVEQQRQRADEEASAAKALEKQAREELREFHQLEGAKRCRACGQELTPAHFQDEMTKREAAAAAAAERARRAQEAQKRVHADEQQARQTLAALEADRNEARVEYREAKAVAEQARNEVQRYLTECADAYRALPDPFRGRVAADVPAEWDAAAYPTAADLDEARGRLAGHGAVRAQLRDAQAVFTRWTSFTGQLEAAKTHLEQLRSSLPPGDPPTLTREHTELKAQEAALERQITAARAALRQGERDLDRLNHDLSDAKRQLTETDGQLRTEQEKRKLHATNVEKALKQLPEKWRPEAERSGLTEVSRWSDELDRLVQKGTEARAEQLRQARQNLEPIRQAVADLEQEAERFSEEARRGPEAVEESLRQAKQALHSAEVTLRTAQNVHTDLERQRKQRDELRGRLRELEREQHYYKALSELLGRERLQRHLVRRAERQIVDHANSVLDRLSGGQLMLRLCGDDGTGADKALELEAVNRSTSQAPINVAFLSGSQRFRVAVSLALGIGQYASRQHRPIESVIIDEGFGCLDRNGRQVMIQELQNLRGHLHCILLVSHQEEFAEAFADGYRFELDGGATKVTRFQR